MQNLLRKLMLVGTFCGCHAGLMAQNVGIGIAVPSTRLHVDGAVRVGTDPNTAAGAGAGAIRWDGTALQYSNGTTWLNLSTTTGTVTNIATGTGLTGGPITTTGTISLANTAVTPGTYGSATTVPQYTVDAQGRITAASNVTITGVTPGGAAGGDLTGTYPNPTVAANAITSAKILDGTIATADLANGAVDLTTKVSGILPVANGGTGVATIPANGIVFGNGTSPIGTTVPTAANTILLWTGAGYTWAPVPVEGRDIDFNASAPGSVDIEPQLDFVHTIQTPATDNFLLQTQAGRFISFNTNGANERMRILSNGRVGIGSINPNTQLDVVGGADAAETNLLTLRSNFVTPGTATGIRFVNSTSATSAVGMGMMVRQMNTGGKSETVFTQHGGGTPYGTLLERMRLSWIDGSGGSPNLRIGTPTGNRGSLSLVGGTGNAFALNLFPNTTMDADNTYTFPANTGTAGQVLRTDGLGNLSWIDPASAIMEFNQTTVNQNIGTTTFQTVHSVTITTTAGQRVLIIANVNVDHDDEEVIFARILRGATQIGEDWTWEEDDQTGSYIDDFVGTIMWVDTPGAGTHTYNLQLRGDDGSTIEIFNKFMVAMKF